MKSAYSSYQALSTSVEELNAKLIAEVARLEEKIALSEKMSAAGSEIAALQADSKNFDGKIQIYNGLVKEAETHRQETKREIFRIITVGGTFSLVVTLIGFATIRTILSREVTKQANHIKAVIDPLVEFQYAYSRGTGLIASKNSKDAILFLEECFRGHEYDQTVLISLLYALDDGDAWEEGKAIVDQIRSHPEKLAKVNNTVFWNNLAVVETEVGITEPAYLKLARQSLDRARELVLQDDQGNQRFILKNLWILDVIEGDYKQAAEMIRELQSINDDGLGTWDEVRQYRTFREHFKSNPEGLTTAGKMWKQLEDARKRKSKALEVK